METRRGWFPNDKVDDDEKRRKDEKEDRLLAAQVAMVKRCDEKVSRRRSRARRREVLEEESRSRAREAVERKRRELETTHRLAAELSRCKSKELHAVHADRFLIERNYFKKICKKKQIELLPPLFLRFVNKIERVFSASF